MATQIEEPDLAPRAGVVRALTWVGIGLAVAVFGAILALTQMTKESRIETGAAANSAAIIKPQPGPSPAGAVLAVVVLGAGTAVLIRGSLRGREAALEPHLPT